MDGWPHGQIHPKESRLTVAQRVEGGRMTVKGSALFEDILKYVTNPTAVVTELTSDYIKKY